MSKSTQWQHLARSFLRFTEGAAAYTSPRRRKLAALWAPQSGGFLGPDEGVGARYVEPGVSQ